MDDTRRNFLMLAGFAPIALLSARRVGAAETPCYDPATLPLSQRNRRRSIGYVEASTDPRKRCGACAFFTAGAGGCGTCQMLSGGPVKAGAVCNSFAPKAG